MTIRTLMKNLQSIILLKSLCNELITRPEESYRLWCVVVCDLENVKNEVVMTRVGSQHHRKKIIIKKITVIHLVSLTCY
jgi:hypothetical protein